MAYSLKQAADATGRTRSALLRAIQTGKVSAKKTEMGEWEIEPAELHRVYPPVTSRVTRTVTSDEEVMVELYQRPCPMTVFCDGIVRNDGPNTCAKGVSGLGRWYYCFFGRS